MRSIPVGERGVTGEVRYSGGGVPFRVSPWNTFVLVRGYCDHGSLVLVTRVKGSL